MGKKNCCEILFQGSLKTLEGEEDMADETVESLAIKFGMILEYLKEIKGSLSELPCDDLGKDVAENAFEIKHLKEAVAELKKEKDEEIYPRLRKAENRVTTLVEQNKGQDAWSAKAWVLILLGIQSVCAVVVYFLTRGGS